MVASSSSQAPNARDYQVRAVHCDHRANDEEIYQALKRACGPLSRSWEKLRAAKKIWIKFNQDWPVPPPTFKGHFQELVSEQVTRALLRLLREEVKAELVCVDISEGQVYGGAKPGTTTTIAGILREFDVAYLDCNKAPVAEFEVPGGGAMFRRYLLSERLHEADAVVSVQKLKNHAYMGITLCLKNLFGLVPTEPLGRPRTYFHHLVRMPYMLADLGSIFNPALNVIDGLVGQAGREWHSKEQRLGNTLIAGDNCVATDACGTHLMGHDPGADWLTPPYHRDRNALRVAAEAGMGTVKLDGIDFQSEVQAPLDDFFADITDPLERVVSWRRTAAEQALYYRDHQKEFIGKYAGEYILLQCGEVGWHDPSGRVRQSRRGLAGDRPDQAMWLKYVDPEEREGENFEVYERALAEIRALGSGVAATGKDA